MLASKTRWKLQHIEQETAERLADQCGIHPLIARLLLVRGYTTPEQVRAFFDTSGEALHDPFLMDGMSEAVEAVRKAIAEERYIRIYGDYDADGISSTALLTWLLRELGAKFDTYIPHRVHEGYGLNKSALEKAKADGVELIITVDTGISAYEEAKVAAELGIDLIITDHHEPPEQLPQAVAVINPKKPGCPYPYKQLAGVGVAFKLAQALTGTIPGHLSELAALGTIADLMPLTGENRIIVQMGLARMQQSSYVGLRALFHESGLDGKEISSGHIGYAVAPRINASGRLTSADAAVKLLTTEHEQEAYHLARELDELNRDRQRIVEETEEEALQQLEERCGTTNLPSVIIVSDENWNAGVIGIVASRLLERFYRPTLVFTIDPETGIAKGSARSISGFDMYRALTECADLLDHYGGHTAAAGMSLAADRLPDLEKRLNALADVWLTAEDYIPLTIADLSLPLEACTVELIEQLEALAPFGIGNRSPRFLLESMKIRELRKIGREGQHLKLQLTDRGSGHVLDAVGFGFASLEAHIAPQAKVDVIGELQLNEWNGIRKPQLLIQDIRVNHLQLFDWRGLVPTRKSAANHSQPYAGLREETTFLLHDDDPMWTEIIAAMFGERRIMVMDEDGNLREPRSASQTDQSRVTDIVLVQLPRSRRQLMNMMTTYGRQLERICVWFADADELAAGCPSRDRFKLIYGVLRQQLSWPAQDRRLLQDWSRRTGMSVNDIAFIISVFEDLGFIERSGEMYELVAKPQPRDLSESTIFKRRAEAQALAEEFMLMSGEMLLRLIQGWIEDAEDVEQAG